VDRGWPRRPRNPKRLIKLQAHSNQVKRQFQSDNDKVNEEHTGKSLGEDK